MATKLFKLAEFSETKMFRLILAFLAGAVIGICISFIINCTLVEVSINPFFAMYFGFIFIFTAGIIVWRIQGDEHDTHSSQMSSHPYKWLVTVFASLLALSGFLCLILEDHWFQKLGHITKIPVYVLLGISTCFALTFAVVDLLNYICAAASYELEVKPLVRTEDQVYLVAITSVIMGACFGFIFGLVDVEDVRLSHLQVTLMREESYCYPFAVFIGGFACVYNQFLREKTTQHIHHVFSMEDDGLDDNFV